MKILIVEDDFSTQEMYVKFLSENFSRAFIHVCRWIEDAENAIKNFEGFDLYVLDGQVLGGHTCSFIDTLPKEKVVVISGEPYYIDECKEKGIKSFMKPFTWTRLRENIPMFEDILTKET